LNYGINFDFLPKLGSLDLPDQGIELAECELVQRVTPSAEAVDFWWTMDAASVVELRTLIFRSDEYFGSFQLDGVLSTLTPEDLGEENRSAAQEHDGGQSLSAAGSDTRGAWQS
jgi:hypothetical protein